MWLPNRNPSLSVSLSLFLSPRLLSSFLPSFLRHSKLLTDTLGKSTLYGGKIRETQRKNMYIFLAFKNHLVLFTPDAARRTTHNLSYTVNTTTILARFSLCLSVSLSSSSTLLLYLTGSINMQLVCPRFRKAEVNFFFNPLFFLAYVLVTGLADARLLSKSIWR